MQLSLKKIVGGIIAFIIINSLFVSYILPSLALLGIVFGNYTYCWIYAICFFVARMIIKCVDMFGIHNTIIHDCLQHYFAVENINKPDLATINDKNLFTYHPHGIFCSGFSAGIGFQLNEIKKCVSRLILILPIFGDYIRFANFVRANKNVFSKYMQSNDNLVILPGGFNEVFMTRKYEYNIYVPTGFIAMCIKHEYTIRPVLCLGENELYDTISLPKRLWKYMFNITKYITLPFIFFYGRLCTMMPYASPITIIYGTPIHCIKTDSVDNIYSKYCQELTTIFTSNIGTYCEKHGFDPKKYSFQIYSNN